MSRRKKNLKFAGGWDNGGASNQEVRAAQPEEPRPASSARYKDKKHWCRGKIGGTRHEDHLAIRYNSWALSWRLYREDGGVACYRAEWYASRWLCLHEWYCTNCGKIVQPSLGADCPNFTADVTRFRRRETT